MRFGLVALPFEPDGTFLDAASHPEDEQGGQGAQPEHGSPSQLRVVAKEWIDVLEGERREDESPREATLQNSRGDPAQVDGPMLHHERRRRGPFTAHADAEQRSCAEQHRVGRGKPAQQREERKPHDGQHQGQLAAPAIRRRASRDAADQPHQKGDGAQRARERTIDGEAFLNVDQDECQDGEVEPVERPSEKASPERTPLPRIHLPKPRLGRR